MWLTIILVAISSLSDVTLSSRTDHAYVIGLFPEPVYDSIGADSTLFQNSPAKGQTIQVKIRNPGDISEDIGFHAFLPDGAEMESFSMTTLSSSYKAKTSDRQMAEEIMKKANAEDHNAVVYIPQPLEDSYKDKIQTAGNTVHIKAGHEMTFDLAYSEIILEAVADDEKVHNRARVSLDLYGTRVEDLNAEISSPNYPNDYPNYADITWWIRVPEGKAVSLQIDDLDIEECCDRLVIYDGASVRASIIAEITGTYYDLETSQFQSTYNNMFLRLATDCSKAFKGFKAITSVVVIATRPPPVTDLPPVFSNSTGENAADSCVDVNYISVDEYSYVFVTSPGYPVQYYNNLNCAWSFQANSNNIVELIVEDMQLESGFDYVYVYDGPSTDSPLLAKLSSYDEYTIYSSGIYMYVNFISDDSATYKGFSLTVTAGTVTRTRKQL